MARGFRSLNLPSKQTAWSAKPRIWANERLFGNVSCFYGDLMTSHLTSSDVDDRAELETVNESQISRTDHCISSILACSQTLCFLFKVRRARVIKYKPQGIYWPPAQRGSGGGRRWFFIFISRAPRSFSRTRFTREPTDVFEKNDKKNKTTSVYGLIPYWWRTLPRLG